MYSLKDIYKDVQTQLRSITPAYYFETDLIITKALKIKRSDLYANPDKILTPSQVRTVNYYLTERLTYKPLPYIFCEREFYGLNFYVDENIFIPRQETEFVVEESLDLIKNNKLKVCADIGTGCGNIAISIVKNIPFYIKMYATDISSDALKVAKKNADRLNVLDKIEFVLSDKLKYFIKNEILLDIIISNPPYITEQEYEKLQPEIYYEPKLALVSNNGIEFYEHFATYAKKILNKDGFIVVEINHNLADEILKIFHNANYKVVKTIKDYQNLPRVMVVKN
ncbi:MAG: peptide chain release factor N(5)-glutamine methyltransferase [Endomicrobia bacterium]|nr:peptide chain release factor N(5)-glutamine methyltransferase [Endomicrobiia bacterium]MDW8056047.1 peptide chain release factor N(5)-glutamine methyltransferase [Elusimicrobiota bacterium]